MPSQNHIALYIFPVIGLLIGLFGFYQTARADDLATARSDGQASFFLLPDKTFFLDPDYLYVDLVLDSGSSTINAFQLSLSFATGSLSLIATGTPPSACQITVSNTANNTLGNYDLQCGLTPGIFPNQVITRLKFQKLTPGFAKLVVDNNSAILAHDGQGTDILGFREIHNIFIVK